MTIAGISDATSVMSVLEQKLSWPTISDMHISSKCGSQQGMKHFALGVPGPNMFHLDLSPKVSCHHKYEKNHMIKSMALPKISVSPFLCIAAVNKFHLAISTVPPEL